MIGIHKFARPRHGVYHMMGRSSWTHIHNKGSAPEALSFMLHLLDSLLHASRTAPSQIGHCRLVGLPQHTVRTHPNMTPDCVAEPCSSVTAMSSEFPASAGKPSTWPGSTSWAVSYRAELQFPRIWRHLSSVWRTASVGLAVPLASKKWLPFHHANPDSPTGLGTVMLTWLHMLSSRSPASSSIGL